MRQVIHRRWFHGGVLLAGLLLGACGGRLSGPGGGSGSFGSPGFFFGEDGPPHPSLRLVSAAAGADIALVDWVLSGLGDPLPEVALFLGASGADPFASQPMPVDPLAGRSLLEGLAPGTSYKLGLGLRMGAGDWQQSGPVLRFQTAGVIYADANSSSIAQDGLTPETAYSDLFLAVIGAFAQGGGNVWIAGGTFTDVSFPMFDGVSLQGGFAPDFELEERDVRAFGTVLQGLSGANVISLDQLLTRPVIDGLLIDGLGFSENGIDINRSDCELRSTSVRGCGRGIKLRTPETDNAPDVRLLECDLFENLVEGFSIDGPANVRASGCLFRDNGAEGMDAGDWIAPEGAVLEIRLSDCAFLRNGSEGLDVDLAAPLAGGTIGGRFELEIVDCDFESNVATGLLIDIDYEATPAWQARFELRGLRARKNGGAGVHLDLDGVASTLIHRLVASANSGDGLLLTSESQVGMATLSASALLGNGGSGARTALGNVGLAVSHCVFSGNLGGGLRGEAIAALAHSSASYLQPDAWQGALLQRCLDIEFSTPAAFLHMPFDIRRITGMQQGMWSLDAQAGFGPQTLCEVDNDGVLRTATAIGASSVTLDPVPAGSPGLLFAFPPSDTVAEDFAPTAGSPLLGAGIIPPSLPATDAGPLGAPFGGTPGEEQLIPPLLFYLASMSPAWGLDLADGGELSLRFEGGVPDLSSAAMGLALVPLGSQQSIPISVAVVGEELRITPLETLPQGPVVIELHGQLRSLAGLALSAPVVLPVRSGN